MLYEVITDIKKDEVKPLIQKYFGEIKPGNDEIVRHGIVEPKLDGEVRDTIFDNVQLPLIFQAYRTPAMETDDFYALDMLSTLLSNGESSRMYKSLVDEQQKAIDTGTFPLPYRDPSLAIAYAMPNMGVDCADLEAAIEDEIKKVRDELITEREMQKLKNQYENMFVSGNVKLARRAENLVTNYVYFRNTNLINTELDKYLSVTREDIKRVANKYLVKDNRVVLYYLPKSYQN